MSSIFSATGRLDGRIAIVTGAASGFGEATARRFHAEGARVVVADIDGEGAGRVAKSLGDGATATRVDVSASDDVAALVAFAVDTFGSLDTLVNNAGVIHPKRPIDEIGEEQFDQVVNVNLRGAFLGIKYATNALRRSARGVVLNMSSVGALRPRRQTSLYSASKAAVLSLTQSAALDLAPGIRVNAVCPVASDTPFLAGGADGDGERLEAYRRQMVEDAKHSVPLGRLATPEDVAAALTFLASEDAAFVTGVALPIDGGRSAGDTAGRVGVAAATS